MQSKKDLTERFAAFKTYLQTSGLIEDIKEIAFRHRVTLLDLYNTSGKTAKVARLEVIWLLVDRYNKSNSEVARIFGHTSGRSIGKQLAALREVAKELHSGGGEAAKELVHREDQARAEHLQRLLLARKPPDQ